MSRTIVLAALCIAMFFGHALAAGAQATTRPAVLLTGSDGSGCGHELAGQLAQAGFALRPQRSRLSDSPLTWESLKPYNVVVLAGLGRANADMTLGRTQQTIDALNRYLEAGGGVLLFGDFGQMATAKPPQDAFLKPLGLAPLFDEMPDDPQTGVVATAWRIPFAFTDAIADSPVSGGVKSLWYPVPRSRIGAQNHTVSFVADSSWQIVVRGSKSSLTRKGALQEARPNDPGTYAGQVPLLAIRQVGKGRIAYLGITHEYLTGANAQTTLEGIVLDHGIKDAPSHGRQLFENTLRWLAEPSLSGREVGGATMDESLLANPNKVRVGKPYPWADTLAFPTTQPASPGVIGPRTRYSSGKASADEWAAKAKTLGLAYLVFLEDFAHLSPGDFEKLKADCTRLSSPQFAAIPGFTIDDEVGNHYFYFGATFPYPDRKFLSEDGKVFRARDAELNAKAPYIPGQLSMTTLDYAYSLASFKLTAGNYLFKQGAAPFADFFSNWDATAVVTARNGKLVEDATADYLKLAASGQGPLPLALDLMDDPAQLQATPWQTILRFPAKGGRPAAAAPDAGDRIRDYFSAWHFYPDNPSPIAITSGPRIESWGYVGPRDYEGNSPGDYVWQNHRWALRGKVSSPVGLKEVAVYDGPRLFRRFLPNGRNEFEFSMDLTHDRQHNLVLIVTDQAGHRAISSEQWDRNQRLDEFMCSDRNNQLTYGYVINKDGIGIMLGGNQTLATPLKRISSGISPSGTFRNDKLLGVPAFDGAAGGDPEVFEQVAPIQPAHPVPVPNVNEARRLMHTMDVMIGDGVREHCFADGIGVHNVWHTLWRTQPVNEYRITRRNHFFQIDPDSPLSVVLWQIEVALKEDLPNQGFRVGMMSSREDTSWLLRGSDGANRAGVWSQNAARSERLVVPFGPNACAAFLDSPLGGAAIFPMTDGLEATLNPPRRGNLDISLPTGRAPQKKGESRQVELLIVGIPRRCPATSHFPPSNELVARFGRDFGLDGGAGGYTVHLDQGTILGRRFLLRIDGGKSGCFSGQLQGNLISSLPITVASLNDGWSSYIYDRELNKARPLGVFEGNAWATITLAGRRDLFIGHPLTADDPRLMIQVTQCGDDAWQVELHNPTDAAIATTIRKNPAFDPLTPKPFTTEAITVPAGTSLHRRL